MTIYRMSLFVLVVALTLAIAGLGHAQEFLLNGGFEDAIGTEWTQTFITGTAASFSVQAPTAAGMHDGILGLQIQVPGTNNATAHTYFSQIVTGLTPGANYSVSGWLKFGTVYNRPDKYHVYMKAIGGLGELASTAQGTNTLGWTQYLITQTADAGGQIEVRLGLNKYGTTVAKQCDAAFDQISVTAAQPVPEPGSMLALLSGLPILGFAIRRKH